MNRGIRNNNPGNIIRTNIPWNGMAARQDDPRFITFKSPEYGIRAIVKILQAYYNKDGCTTIRSIINRWAPPEENDTEHYIDDVATRCGLSPDDRCDIRDSRVVDQLVRAIIHHEEGVQPYDDATIAAGLKLAGVS